MSLLQFDRKTVRERGAMMCLINCHHFLQAQLKDAQLQVGTIIFFKCSVDNQDQDYCTMTWI